MGSGPEAVLSRPVDGNIEAWNAWVASSITQRLKRLEHCDVLSAFVEDAPPEQRGRLALYVQPGGVDVRLSFAESTLELLSCIATSGSKRIDLNSRLLSGHLKVESVEKQGEHYAITLIKEGSPGPVVLWTVSLSLEAGPS